MYHLKGSRILMAMFVCLLFTFMSCKKGDDPVVVHINKQSFTKEEQIEIGDRLKQIITDSPEFDILDEVEYAEVYTYFNTLLRTLTITPTVQNRTDFDWEISIIKDDSKLSAFTAPGGKIFLYTGLLKFIESENEISCLLGHEIKYVDDESVLNTLKTEYGGDVLGDILLGHDTEDINTMAHKLNEVSFSKNSVIDADDYTMEVHCNFTYDVMGIKTIIDRAESTGTDMLWLSTRPTSTDRINNIVNSSSNCGGINTYEERYQLHRNQLP